MFLHVCGLRWRFIPSLNGSMKGHADYQEFVARLSKLAGDSPPRTVLDATPRPAPRHETLTRSGDITREGDAAREDT